MQPVLQRKNFQVALLSMCTLMLAHCPAVFAADSPTDNNAAQSSADSEDPKKEIEKLLAGFEHDWNAHNLDAVMAYYADDYVNNDGFDKKTIQKLTEELWKTYPDIKSSSLVKQIRIEGPYASVESHDEAVGSTNQEMPGLGTKGELKSISEGQLYCKHVGLHWRITGDRIDYEKIKVSYGAARQLEPIFAAPEQVKSGKQFSARLEVDLPTGLGATGSISQTSVSFPLPKISDKYKQIGDPLTDRPLLERVMTANSKNRNELLMATVVLTNASGNSIMGVVMLTRRLNVVPIMEDDASKAENTTAQASTSEHKIEEQTSPNQVK